MNSFTRQPARPAAAGVLAGALALSLAAVTAVPAGAALGLKLERVAGPDRYATSAAIADRFGGATGALLASGEAGRYADALSANFLAGVRNVPVLLTQKDTTPAVVLAALGRAGARDITLVGGTDVISAAQETALRDAGFTVTRLGGADRFATSREVVAAGQASAAPVGLVATGLDFADALGAGPLSYRGKHPMFLVRKDSVPMETLTAMRAAGTTSVIIVGGEAVVGTAVVDALRGAGITVVTRLAGSDRSATSVEVADYLLAAGYDRTAFNLASGQNGGVDALGGAALSGRQNRALLITNTASNAGAVMGFAEANRATLTGTGLVFGGTAAVSDDVVRVLETTGGMGQSNQTFSVTPNTAATLPLVGTEDGSAAADSDNRTYSVATPAAGAVHQIRLVPASSVRVDANGGVTFADADGTPAGAGNDLADFGPVSARIVNVNSVDLTTPVAATTAIPVGGTITFEIEGNSAESVIPVVFFDADLDGNLDLNADNTPAAAEVFGVGGVTTFFNRAASTGDAAGSVGSVNKGANQFDANDRTFTYDANDVFRIGTAQVTLDEFEAALSAGDSVAAIDYQANPALASTFTLTNTNPGTAPNPTATIANSNDVTVTVDLGTGANVDSVVFQRAAVTGGMAGAFATIATEAATDDVTGTAGVQVVYVDNDVPAGTYQYRALLVNDGDTGDASAAPVQVVTTTPAPADTTAPTIVDARVGANGGSAFLLEVGDSFLLAFSEVIAAPTAGDTFRVTDGDGTTVDVLAGGATLNTTDVTINGTVYGPGRVLTVSRSTDDVLVVNGSEADLGLPATITAQAGTVDAAGNQVNLAGSADVIVDTEAGTVVVAAPTADTTAPTLNAAVAAFNGAGPDTVVLTFSEPISAFGGIYDNAQVFYDADCNGGPDSILGSVSQTGTSAVTLTLVHGALPLTDDANDCVGYVDGNSAAVDAGDIVDAAGNPLATNSSATVPAAV